MQSSNLSLAVLVALLPGPAVRSMELFRVGPRRHLGVAIGQADEPVVLRIGVRWIQLPVVLGQREKRCQPGLRFHVAVTENEVGKLAPRVSEDRRAAAG